MEREQRSWGKNLRLASMFSLVMAATGAEGPKATITFVPLESQIFPTPIRTEIPGLPSFLEPFPTPIPEPESTEGKSVSIRSDDFIAPQNIVRGNEERPEVALTFDCGPWVNRPYIEQILDVLEQSQTRVTFFVTGEFIRKNPDIFERIAASHEIANHSWYHPDFTKLSSEEQAQELNWTEDLIKTYGVTSKPMWRSPFGAFTNETIWNAAYNGYRLHIMWTVDSGDWQNISPETVQKRVVDGASNGAIVVSHCNSEQTAKKLESILIQLQERGFTPTTVSALLR